MNPREFCSLPGYTAALFLTYDFDPVFFERVVLRELWAGGTGDIVVVADRSRVDASLDRWGGGVVHLGRRYQLIPAAVEGAFHPKVILRAGPEGVIAWVGSGNLTFGGWGGNREMSAAWTLGDDDSAWIRSLMQEVDVWCPSGATHDVPQRIRNLPSMSALMLSEGPGPTPVLLARAGDPISDQIARRWSGRHFEEAKILTGSTDRAGAFLNWLHDVFGVNRATVAVDPGRASFDPALLKELPVQVETLETGFDSPLHAKLCLLSGSGGSVAVMGSANCSRSAWLRDPAHGGNVEVVAVYDQASQKLVGEISAIFDEARIYTPRPPEQQDTDVRDGVPRYRVTEITWAPRDSELTIRFIRAIPTGARVEVIVDRKVECHPISSSDLSIWVAFVSLEDNARTRFADVTLFLDDSGEEERQRHWVNNHEELIHAAQGRQIENVFDGMRRRLMPTEQRRILRELHRIGAVLLTEHQAFPDPDRAVGSRRDRDKEQTEPNAEITPVDPETLVRSLGDAPVRHWPAHGGGWVGFSLFGIMRALFPEQPPPIDDDEVAEGDSPRRPKPPPSGAPKDRVPEPVQGRLKLQMERFIKGFTEPAFAESCSARQLVQAAAYPLAVGIVGTQGGWVSGGDAVFWARRIFDTLFQKRSRPSVQYSGILEGVRQRLADEGKKEIFQEVVGDGTLWLTLLKSLSLGEWSGSGAAFERALALRDAFNARILLSSTDNDKITRLIGRAEWDSLLMEADGVVRALDGLENALESDWDALVQFQEDAAILHEPDDLLWSPKVGWAVAQEKAVAERAAKFNVYLRLKAQVVRVVAAGFYVNVTKAKDFRSGLEAVLAAERK